jgi:predicted NBD/HSP70 family sugar kinase
MNEHKGLALRPPAVVPVLDPAFRPAALAHRAFLKNLSTRGTSVPVELALERSPGSVSRFRTALFAEDQPEARGNFFYLERLLKFLLWSRGGATVYLSAPEPLVQTLQEHFKRSATGQFDAMIMGKRVYERPFQIVHCPAERLPCEEESSAPLGRHLDGCRIGFDLGASDRKAAAVIDGQVVFSQELPWDPLPQCDPQWHFDKIMESLKGAAAHLPRVDAIGGSSAGIYVQNQVKVASLFRGISPELFQQRVKNLFLDLQRAWNNVPFEVVNDGEVTALAGSMSLKENAVLGLAMGSSEAAGYVTPEGNITSWLNELAFAPVDYRPNAPPDEWSGDQGCGVQYFSQQAVGRLIPASGIEVESGLALPEKLVAVQERMKEGDERAANIYRTIGVYLGYAIGHYRQFYDFRHLLVLGRVTSGPGGGIILEEAKKTLGTEFPELAALTFHVPDEHQKRHGQAIAAASLPARTRPTSA